jgi:nucleoside 2-deoxyribosyltransferase
MKRRIYLASSWRNTHQPQVLEALRADGHEVYDFRNPAPGNAGFAWTEIDRDWPTWSPEAFASLVTTHPVAAAGFALDKAALDWCDTCVIVLPCGRSAHLEAGYAAGQGKQVVVLLHADKFEPELMYLLCDGIVCTVGDLLAWLKVAVE